MESFLLRRIEEGKKSYTSYTRLVWSYRQLWRDDKGRVPFSIIVGITPLILHMYISSRYSFIERFQMPDGYSGRNTCQETFVNEDSHLLGHMALC